MLLKRLFTRPKYWRSLSGVSYSQPLTAQPRGFEKNEARCDRSWREILSLNQNVAFDILQDGVRCFVHAVAVAHGHGRVHKSWTPSAGTLL